MNCAGVARASLSIDRLGRARQSAPARRHQTLESRVQTGNSDLVLVTGASGFVGAAIAPVLRGGGLRIRVWVRPPSPRTNLDRGDEIALGDLRDRASLAAALRGVRFLFHAAADYRLWAPDPRD